MSQNRLKEKILPKLEIFEKNRQKGWIEKKRTFQKKWSLRLFLGQYIDLKWLLYILLYIGQSS